MVAKSLASVELILKILSGSNFVIAAVVSAEYSLVFVAWYEYYGFVVVIAAIVVDNGMNWFGSIMNIKPFVALFKLFKWCLMVIFTVLFLNYLKKEFKDWMSILAIYIYFL